MRDGDRLTVFTRGTDGALRAQTAPGGDWSRAATTDLGGPTHGRILGQPAAYASSGGRIDVFVEARTTPPTGGCTPTDAGGAGRAWAGR